MAIVVTGTPGVGKTTLSRLLSRELGIPHIELASLVKEKKLYRGYDEERESYIVDENRVKRVLDQILTCNEIVDSHVLTCIPADKVKLVVVLRLDPLILKARLEERGYPVNKVKENVEAEVLGIILSEAIAHFGEKRVKEINLTGLSVEEALSEVLHALRGGDYPPGRVDWLEKYWELLQ